MVAAPIVDHIAAAAVFLRQAIAPVKAMIRPGAAFALVRIAALAVLVRVTPLAVPMRVAAPSMLVGAALVLPVSAALREGWADHGQGEGRRHQGGDDRAVIVFHEALQWFGRASCASRTVMSRDVSWDLPKQSVDLSSNLVCTPAYIAARMFR
jgi:hypothetical protein